MFKIEDVSFFKPFVEGTLRTLKVQCQLEAKADKPYYKNPDKNALSEDIEIAGVIGFTSANFNGSLTLCFPCSTFLKIMSNMLGEEYSEIDKDLEDGAAELLNIIFGQAKKDLNEQGFSVEMALPTVLRGKIKSMNSRSDEKSIILPFKINSEFEFCIEIGTAVQKA